MAAKGENVVEGASPGIGLGTIFAAFLRLGCTSFGGAMPAWIYRDLVQRRGWLDDAAFLSSFALGQTLPGSNGVKLTVLAGQRLHGLAGAVTALIGLLAGPFAIIVAIATVYKGLSGNPPLHRALDGVAAAAIGLTFATGLRSLLRGRSKERQRLASYAISAATVVAVGVLRWPMFWVLLCLAPLSVGLAAARQRRV